GPVAAAPALAGGRAHPGRPVALRLQCLRPPAGSHAPRGPQAPSRRGADPPPRGPRRAAARLGPPPPPARPRPAGGPAAAPRADLWHCRLGPEGARVLGACPAAAGLRELRLALNSLGTEGVALLAEAPYLARLTALDLSENPFGMPAMRALAASPLAGRLTRL